MHYKLVSLVSFMVLTLCLAAAGEAGPRDTNTIAIVNKVLPSLVKIAVPRNSGLRVVGAGYVVDSRGYVQTENHVTNGHDHIFVGLPDGTFVAGQVVFSDKDEDLCLVKIESAKVPRELTLGPSSDVKVGEPAIVIGNPEGLGTTVTQGIISRLQVPYDITEGDVQEAVPASATSDRVKVVGKKSRPLDSDGKAEDTAKSNNDGKKSAHRRYLIQTDAAVNPGNSGGPLFNANGEVIGMIELKMSDDDGIGWAISADRVQRIEAQSMSAENVAGVIHGVKSMKWKVVAPEGAHRQAVMVDKLADRDEDNNPAPAEKAGLRVQDRVTRVGDRFIDNAFDFERAFWDSKPGDRVVLTVVRGTQTLHLTITLGGSGKDPEIKD